jgi:tRNA(adenine34) deaminase
LRARTGFDILWAAMARASGNSNHRDNETQAVHERFMRMALDEARNALHLGEVPVGAVLVMGHDVIATGFNQAIRHVDPTAHAEIVALRQAAEACGNYRLPGSTLYVTIEPCLMCVGALIQARVSTVVYGVVEPKCGALRSLVNLDDLALNHRFAIVSGILEADCRKILQDFFKFRRQEG